jgi:prolyl oligopeptidase
VLGERALAWVRERNAHSRAVLQAHPRFAEMRDGFRAILDSRDRIPAITRRAGFVYNLWQDAEHPRGLWRRCTLASYRLPQPDWDVLLDIDALGAAEGENWVWAGASALGPVYNRALVSLSRGGADAHVVREFDIGSRSFVADGFTLPEAKSDVSWADADTVYVGSDFGPGSLTDSGYPRVIKRWQRGTPLSAASTVFEGQPQDVSASVGVDRTPGFERTLFWRSTDFYHHEVSLLQPDGTLLRLPIPDDATPSFWGPRVLLQLRSDWPLGDQIFAGGSLLVAEANALLAGQTNVASAWTALFTPTATRSLAGFDTTRSQLLLEVLDNVAGKLEAWHFDAGEAGPGQTGQAGRWVKRDIAAPYPGTLSVTALHDPLLDCDGQLDPLGEAYLLGYTDFLTPDSLLLGNTASDDHQPLKARPAFFDTTGMRVEQRHATSADGTQVPYFIVWPAGATANAANPTLLYGYGGFEVSLQPWYGASYGSAWFAHGGVLVVANIRGGGEFGPAWHQGAALAHKQRSYDDFAAVAADLINSGVTRAERLAIQGGSNGGLLVGAVMVQRPELLGAVVCQVPLLDMRRYHQLLAGASWMAEYGDPDDAADWAVISRYSPYQNVQAGVKMAPVLFTTSTRDDRVHPGHARKMAARMIEQGHDVLYYENIEGGHGGAADNGQKADMLALEFAFLWQRLAG